MKIISGKIQTALKAVVYGPEGIGKSTFAAKFPRPLFIDTEGSTKHMTVDRMEKPSSWTMLLEQVKYIKTQGPSLCGTLVLDTADWAEMLCTTHICGKHQVDGIEGIGYGKGYTYLAEEFGRLLNLLEEVVQTGIHVVVTAHANMRKFEQPDEMGAYDRWELKLQKKTAALVKEWADMVLFANYKTVVVNVDNQGALKGKNKAQGGKRVMYTAHNPCWDAKNRHGLEQMLDFDYQAIAHLITDSGSATKPVEQTKPEPPKPAAASQATKSMSSNGDKVEKVTTKEVPAAPPESTPPKEETPKQPEPPSADSAPPKEEKPAHWAEDPGPRPDLPHFKPLYDLMDQRWVTVAELKEVVAARGYYTKETPLENYDPQFVAGVLIGAWPKVLAMIEENREETPF